MLKGVQQNEKNNYCLRRKIESIQFCNRHADLNILPMQLMAQTLISISDVDVTEGDAGTVNANFTVALSAVSGQTITVDYATSDGTGDSERSHK